MARRMMLGAVLFAVLAGCSKGTTPSVSGEGGQATSVAPGAVGGSGGATVDGSLTTSGAYTATWAWESGLDAVAASGITLKSDRGTFAHIIVKPDETIDFGSGAPELAQASDFTGTGAQVNKKGDGGVACTFTLDNDLTGTDGTVLHVTGNLTIHDPTWGCP